MALPEHWNVHDVFHKRMLQHSLAVMLEDVSVDDRGEAVYSFPVEEGDTEAREVSKEEAKGLSRFEGQHSEGEPKELGELAEEVSQEEPKESENPEEEE